MSRKKIERRGRPENLKPPTTKEEARKRGRNGGIKSGIVRKQRKTFAEALKIILNSPLKPGSKLYAKTKETLRQMGIDEEPTAQHIPLIGMLKAAAYDPKAATWLRDTIGEMPIEKHEEITPTPPLILGILPTAKQGDAPEKYELHKDPEARKGGGEED